MKEIECIVHGKVQMVMFRDFVKRYAQRLGIVGVVKNLKDGTVKVLAQGEEASLTQLIAKLHKGPFLAHVVRVEVVWQEPKKNYTSFTIER
jgi:acylphosphatase